MIRREIFRFAVVGASASAVHAAVGITASWLGLVPLAANTAGFIAALGVSYLGNSLWTFGVDAARPKAFARFVVLALAAFASNQAIVYGLTAKLGWSYAASLLVVLATVPALTFLAARSWALVHRPAA